MSAIESETALGFVGLHQMLLPFLDRLDGLPPLQRDALRRLLGIGTGDPPNRFLARRSAAVPAGPRQAGA